MDKKKQFQLQTSQGKLIKYKETLQTLQDTRLKLDNTTNKSNLDRSIIIALQQKQINLETKQQLFKKDINLNVNKISNSNKDLLLLDKLKDDKNIEEDNIFNDEISRIEEYIIEIKDKHNKSIESAYLDKLELSNNIELIKNELDLQNKIISEIQIISHSSRKQTLEELHIKKQDKIITQQHITNFKEYDIDIRNQIQALEKQNNDIIEFKKLLIDKEYNIEYDNTKLSNLYVEFNNYTDFSLDTQISINDKIASLDKIYNNNQNKIQYINKKFSKNKQSNAIKLKHILDTYNSINRVKVIGYKDKYKIEKEKRTQLENVLSDMSNKYETFETSVIITINNYLKNMINESENDKLRAVERLNIMKERIIVDYENEKKRINDIIIDSKLNLENISKDFNNCNIELDNIKEMIIKEDIIGNELYKIDIEIVKYQDIIKQIESDIESMISTISKISMIS
jgi:hypothetical protein